MRCDGTAVVSGPQTGPTDDSAPFCVVPPAHPARGCSCPREQSWQELTGCSSHPSGPRKCGKALLRKSRREHKDKDNPLGGTQGLQTSQRALAGAAHSLDLHHRILGTPPVLLQPVPSPRQLKVSSFWSNQLLGNGKRSKERCFTGTSVLEILLIRRRNWLKSVNEGWGKNEVFIKQLWPFLLLFPLITHRSEVEKTLFCSVNDYIYSSTACESSALSLTLPNSRCFKRR